MSEGASTTLPSEICDLRGVELRGTALREFHGSAGERQLPSNTRLAGVTDAAFHFAFHLDAGRKWRAEVPRGFHQRSGGQIAELQIAGPFRSGQIVVQPEFHRHRIGLRRRCQRWRVPDDGRSD